MDTPTMMETRRVAEETFALSAYVPLPGFGVLPANAFVIRGPEPVLVDTGLAALGEEFMAALRAVVAPEALRWIWLTHVDADHVGNLAAVLAEAPQASVVTSYLGMGKLGLLGHTLERPYLINPGEHLALRDRTLVAVKPATFDAPETTGLYDPRTRALFSSDSFGAILQAPAPDAADIAPDALREGQVAWATVDAPWLADVDGVRFGQRLAGIRALEPAVVLSSHLPPAAGLTDTMLGHLDAAREAPPFVGPNQAALEAMLAGAAAA